MRVAIFGLGYVGATTAACLAKEGHRIVGVDPDSRKRQLISDGKSPIIEEGLEGLIRDAVDSGALTVTEDFYKAVSETDMALISVGTPSMQNGNLGTNYISAVATEIGKALQEREGSYTVVVRSTVLPGTTADIVIPALESAIGREHGDGFEVVVNPEFLREGTSIKDFYQPPFTIVGARTSEAAQTIAGLYAGLPAEVVVCDIATAEAVKYTCNLFHALKITFANEVGSFCKEFGIDSRPLLDIVCRDTKLNISTAYMRPGFAFGGSCLPKDLRAFNYKAKTLDINLPALEALIPSNRAQIDRIAQRVMARKTRKIAMVGISFKEGTDDLRESPLVALAEALIGKGYDLRIYDPNVVYASLFGSNKAYIDAELPHLKRVLVDADDLLAHGDVIVFGHAPSRCGIVAQQMRAGQHVLDLVGPQPALPEGVTYEGLYW